MWYNIDLVKFVLHLLPPILRRRKLWAITVVTLLPLTYVYSLFRDYRLQALARLNINGQVIYIEKVLNDRFFLKNREIYITDISDRQMMLNLRREGVALVYLNQRLESFDTVYITKRGEGNAEGNYIVNAPDFLTDYESDIRQSINYYNPAGRTYVLKFYKYE